MTFEQLVGKCMRLRAELTDAYARPEWNTRHLIRLSSEIAELEQAMAKQPQVAQAEEPLTETISRSGTPMRAFR